MENMLLNISSAEEHLRLPTEPWFAQHRHSFLSLPVKYLSSWLYSCCIEYQFLV